MKTIAYIPIHYGLEYLKQTIESLDPVVDQILCIYSPNPSYGHGSPGRCPESETDLMDLAFSTSQKIMWKKIRGVSRENQHRNEAFKYAADFDVMITLDTDEVWEPSAIDQAIQDAANTDSRNIGVNGFVHFFRGFQYEVKDGFLPVRLHNLRSRNNETRYINSKIYHFGYCQAENIMRYKWTIHGHQAELQKNYLDGKFYKWTGIDCGVEWLHPVSLQIWRDAEPFDKNSLPGILKAHPNFNKVLI